MTLASLRWPSRKALVTVVCNFIFVICAAIMPARVTAAQNFRDGLSAYNLHRYADALANWGPLAAQGDTNAQASIGYMYLMGRGVPQNDRTAARYFANAAAQGQPDAQYFLGMMYLRGRGVKQDYARAHVLCELAMTLGAPRGVLCRDEAITHLDTQQLEKGYREVGDWYDKFQQQ